MANTTMRGGWQCSKAMQLMFVRGLEHALSTLDNASLKECTRIGLQDDMTFVGSAARLNGAWDELEATPCKSWPLAPELQGQGVCSLGTNSSKTGHILMPSEVSA